MSLENILQDNKEDLLAAVEHADDEFVKLLAKKHVISDSEYQDYRYLDHDRLDSRLVARYIFRVVYDRILQDKLQDDKRNDTFSSFTCILSQHKFSMKVSLILRDELSKIGIQIVGYQQPLANTDIAIQSDHIPVLTDLLADCEYQWEEIAIALHLEVRIIKQCRTGSSDFVRLHNVLTNWHHNTKHAHLSEIIKALQRVNQKVLAGTLHEKFKQKVFDKMKEIQSQKQHLLETTEVDDGKSTLLGVNIPYDGVSSCRWMKNNQHLNNDTNYSGVQTDVLLIRKISQGMDGDYTCVLKHQNNEIIKNVKVTMICSPLKQCLLDKYSLLDEIPSDSWPPRSTSTFIELALIHDKSSVNKEFDYSIRGDIDDILEEKNKVEYKSLFAKHEHKSLVLIEGRPGSGKTTLTHKLTRDWATNPNILKGSKYVYLISLRMLNSNQKDESLSDIFELFYNKKDHKEAVEMLESCYGQGACFILDGLDEYGKSSSVITKLICKEYLRKAMVIVASRPVGTANLRQCRTHLISKRIEVLGFSKPQIYNYIHEYDFNPPNGACQLEVYLNSHINVLHMCYLPVHSAMICFIFDQREEIPNTETKIYELFTLLTIKRRLIKQDEEARHSLHSLKDLVGRNEEQFIKICKLAFDMTVSSKQTILASKTGVQLSDGSGCDVHSLGLVTVDSTAKLFDFEDLYTFLHLTFQEFLAACHIASLDEDEQLKIIQEYINKDEMIVVWKFYCGIIQSKDCLIQAVMSSTKLNDLQKIQCIFESQRNNALQYIINCRESNVLSFEDQKLLPSDFNALQFVQSTASDVRLELNNCVLDESSISKPFKMDQIKYFKFSSTHCSVKEHHLLNMLLSKSIPSLESLDLTGISLEVGISELTENVVLSNLKVLKIKLPFKALTSSPDASKGLKMLSFNSKILKEVHYTYINKEYITHKKTFFYLLESFECEIIPIGDFPSDTLLNTNINLSKIPFILCLSSLELINCSIDDNKVEVITKAKSGIPFKTLRLDINRITDVGAILISNLMRDNSDIQYLSLSCNYIGNEGAVALAGVMADKLNFVKLDLQCNTIGDEGALAIAKSTENFPAGFQLLLWNTNITHEGQEEILKYRNNAQVRHERTEHTWKKVSTNSKDMIHSMKFIYKWSIVQFNGKSFNIVLTKIFKDDQLKKSEVCILNSFLIDTDYLIECVDLTIQILGEEEITKLTKNVTLPHLNVLKIKMPLNISCHDNNLTTINLQRLSFNSSCLQEVHYKYHMNMSESHKQTLSYLIDAFECKLIPLSEYPEDILSNSCVDLSRVQHFLCLSLLTLINCNMDDHGVEVLTSYLHTGYKSLRLDVNRITCTGAGILSNVLRECTEIQQVSISHNYIGDEGAIKLADALVDKYSLVELDLQNNAIGVEGAVAVTKTFKEFPANFQLYLWNTRLNTEGKTTVLNPEQTVLIKQCNSEHVWRVIHQQYPDYIVKIIQLYYKTVNLQPDKKCFDLPLVIETAYYLKEKNSMKVFELVDEMLISNILSLQQLDLTKYSLGEKEIYLITKILILPNLEILLLKMPLKISTVNHKEVLKQLTFKSRNLRQVYYTYIESCEATHKNTLSYLLETFECEIVPVSIFSEDILSNIYVDLSRVQHFLCLSSLTLINCDIDDDGVEVLTNGKCATSYKSLRLDVNRITCTGAGTLAISLRNWTELQHLSLSYNHIGDEGAIKLADALATNHSLMMLDLQCNAIRDEGAVAIAQASKEFHANFQLLLWNNSITIKGKTKVLQCGQIVHFLKKNTDVWKMVSQQNQEIVLASRFFYKHINPNYNLSRSVFTSAKTLTQYLNENNRKNVFELMNEMLISQMSLLEKLDLTEFNLERKEINTLTKNVILTNLKLIKLKMSFSAYSSIDSIPLLKLLSFNSKNIQQVHYTYENYETNHRETLLDLLEVFQCEIVPLSEFSEDILSNVYVDLSRVQHFLFLSSLTLINCDIDDEGVEVLTNRKCSTSYKSLRLDVNRITCTGAGTLSTGLRKWTELQHLSLSYNHIGDEGAIKLADALVRNHSLMTLDLQCNAIRDEGAVAIARATQERHIHLQVLLSNVCITSQGKSKVLKHRKTAQIKKENTDDAWKIVSAENPDYILPVIRFFHKTSLLNFEVSSPDLYSTKTLTHYLKKNYNKNVFHLMNERLISNASSLQQLDLTEFHLGREEILTLTKNVTLTNLKLIKLKMPFQKNFLQSAFSPIDSISLLKLLSFNSKNLQQVHYTYQSYDTKHREILSDLIEVFQCEIVPLSEFPENILSNIYVDLSRVQHFLCLSSLTLINCNIDDDGVKVLTSVKCSTSYKSLRLDVNRITCTGAETLSTGLRKWTELQHLSLSYNHIGDEGAIKLADALAKNHSLMKLDLQCNAIRDEGAVAIAKATQECHIHLQVLLSNVCITSQGKSKVLKYRKTAQIEKETTDDAWKIVSVENPDYILPVIRFFYKTSHLNFEVSSPDLYSTKTLTHYSKKNNNKNVFHLMNERLISNASSLQQLDLTEFHLGREEILTLTKNVALTNLELIKLKMPFQKDFLQSTLSPIDSVSLLKLLSFNSKNLQQVHYTYQSFDTKHREILSDLIEVFQCEIIPLSEFPEDILSNIYVDLSRVQHFLCLSSLTLINCDIDDDGVEFLTNGKCSTSYKSLRLDVNRITCTGAGILSIGLSKWTKLQRLTLSYNHIGDKGAIKLADALVRNHSLMMLDLQCNAIRDEGAVAVSKACQEFHIHFQVLLTNICITSQGKSKVLKYRKAAQIEKENTNDTRKVVSTGNPDYIFLFIRFYYKISHLNFEHSTKTFNHYFKKNKKSLFHLMNEMLISNSSSLQQLDLTEFHLRREEIFTLTGNVTLTNLKLIKINMPFKKDPLQSAYSPNDSVPLLKILSFNSKSLQQVHYSYQKSYDSKHSQTLSDLLEAFQCEIVPLSEFPEDILSNIYIDLSRVQHFLCLSSLTLINCNIDDEGVEVLTNGKCSTSYKSLRLDVNRITCTGAGILSNGLRQWTELQHLSLSYNHIGDEGAVKLADALGDKHLLTKLNLQCNALGNKGAVAIAKVFTNYVIDYSVYLWNIQITSEGRVNVLKHAQSAQIEKEITDDTFKIIELMKNQKLVQNLKFYYRHIGTHFDLPTTKRIFSKLNEMCCDNQFELLNMLISSVPLKVLDLTEFNLWSNDAKTLALDVKLLNLKILKINMPFKEAIQYADVLQQLTFKSKCLEQVQFKYLKNKEMTQRQCLVLLLETFDCEISALDTFPEDILSNVRVDLSRVPSFFNVSSLVLVNSDIKDSDIHVLSDNMSVNQLRTLRLDLNKITDDGALILSTILNGYTELVNLSVSYNFIGDEGAIAIAEALVSCCHLLQLDLQSNNSISDTGAVTVVKTLKHFPETFNLYLWNVKISTEGRVTVLKYRENTQIQEEQIQALRIVDIKCPQAKECALTFFYNCSQNFKRRPVSSLNEINLSNSKLDTSVLYNWRQITAKLQSVHFSHCEIGYDLLRVLAPALGSCTNLKILNLSNNCIGGKGMQLLVYELKECRLESLNVCGNNIDHDGAAALARGLRRGKKLYYLDNHRYWCSERFRHDKLGEDCPSLFEHKWSTSLTDLDLGDNSIDDDGIQVLAYGLKNCCKVMTVTLTQNNYSAEGLDEFKKTMTGCHHHILTSDC